MSKNKINEKPKRELTKKQLSHWQKESRVQHFTMIGGIIVILAIVVLVATGIFMNRVAPLRAVVLKIDNTEYTMDYLINTLTYMGVSQDADPSLGQFYTSYAKQQISQNHILVKEAAKLTPPIIVNDAEVTKKINEDKLSSDQTRIDSVRTQLLLKKLKTEYFGKQVPVTAEHRSVWAMFLGSQVQVDAIKTRLDKGEDFKEIAATFSLENISREKRGEFGKVPQGILSSNLGNSENSVLEEKVFSSNTQIGLITSIKDNAQAQNVGYWLLKIVETRIIPAPTPTNTPEPDTSTIPTPVSDINQVHLYAMLVENETLAKNIKGKLTAGGEGNDFVTLAKSNSLLADVVTNNGDLGWISKGEFGSAIDNIIFPADPSQALAKDKLSDPVQNSLKGGFWLFQVNGIENQTISDDNREILINNALDIWFKKIWADNEKLVQDLLTEDQMTYAFKEAQKR